jgi:E3 ubiquitin-protein ligase SHPRH
LTGEEYEDSTKTQDEVMAYVTALRAVVADRHDALTGQHNINIQTEVKTALRIAKEGFGPFPEKMLELLEMRKQLKPPNDMGSIRGIVGELRELASSLRPDAENGSGRAQNELSIVEKNLTLVQKQLSEQMKLAAALDKEIGQCGILMNSRMDYYRQLQQVSDMVTKYEGPKNERVIAKLLEDEERLQRKIATARSKRRYLEHLRMEAKAPQEQRVW